MHRGHAVEHHAQREEALGGAVVGTGELLHRGPHPLVPALDDVAYLAVVARGERLQLNRQEGTVTEQVPVPDAHRDQRVVPDVAGSGRRKCVDDFVERFPDDQQKQFLLGPEQPENVRLGNVRAPRDGIGRRTVQTGPGKLLGGDPHYLCTALVDRHPFHSIMKARREPFSQPPAQPAAAGRTSHHPGVSRGAAAGSVPPSAGRPTHDVRLNEGNEQ